jgi:hypothetical protein
MLFILRSHSHIVSGAPFAYKEAFVKQSLILSLRLQAGARTEFTPRRRA